MPIAALFNSEIGKNEPGAAILVSYDGKTIIDMEFGMKNLEVTKLATFATKRNVQIEPQRRVLFRGVM